MVHTLSTDDQFIFHMLQILVYSQILFHLLPICDQSRF